VSTLTTCGTQARRTEQAVTFQTRSFTNNSHTVNIALRLRGKLLNPFQYFLIAQIVMYEEIQNASKTLAESASRSGGGPIVFKKAKS